MLSPTDPTDAAPLRALNRRRLLACLAALPVLAEPARAAAAGRGLQRLQPRPHAPALRLTGLDGKTYDLSAQQGRVVVVNFWSVYCRACKAEMPALDALARQHPEIAVWGVAAGDSPETVVAFANQVAVGFPLLPDPQMLAASAWSVPVLPVTDVIDPQGRIALRMIGEADWDQPPLRDQVLALAAS